MAATSYEYDVIDDFPDDKVDGDALTQQAQAAGLAKVQYVNTVWRGDPAREKADVWCSDALDPAEEVTLDGVVAAHDGDPVIAPYTFDTSIAARQVFLQNETEQDTEVGLDRDSVGNMTFVDQNNTTKTLTELATAGQPDLSKVVLEVNGSLVYTGDGDITTVE